MKVTYRQTVGCGERPQDKCEPRRGVLVGVKEIATARNLARSELVAGIDRARQEGSLSSALRLCVLETSKMVRN